MTKTYAADVFERKYRTILKPLSDEEGGGWFAEHPDLPGCASDGETPEEAVTQLADARAVWISAQIATGDPVPEPVAEEAEEYSGRVTFRMPKSLHRKLAEAAKHDECSLNQYMLTLLSEGHTKSTTAQHRVSQTQ